MAEHDPAYVASLANQLTQRHPDLLARAENDLALVARFIHNPTHCPEARRTLARILGLPEPTR